MPDYAILLYPAANRVYTESAQHLLRGELAVFGAVLETPVREIGERMLGGVKYVTFSCAQELTETDVAYLSNLSSLYALFELVEDLCKPVFVRPADRFDSDLLTIQKYSGKTNELFTRLLVNLTVLASDAPAALLTGSARLLDPLCGRGTTLNQAMTYGFNATGIDTDAKDFEAYTQFIKTWLRTKRIKHTAHSGQARKNKVVFGRQLDIEFGITKQRYKAGDTRTVRFLNADTLATAELLRPNSADLIVADAPYGVQHASHHRRDNSRTRGPAELLSAALPHWAQVLRAGGAIGISWNTYVATRADLVELLTKTGFEVRAGGPFEKFAHRVDQAIVRDLVVAQKPR